MNSLRSVQRFLGNARRPAIGVNLSSHSSSYFELLVFIYFSCLSGADTHLSFEIGRKMWRTEMCLPRCEYFLFGFTKHFYIAKGSELFIILLLLLFVIRFNKVNINMLIASYSVLQTYISGLCAFIC
jgi:hypothetical protein